VTGVSDVCSSDLSFEDFGLLYKVQYELRFNRDGYIASVYASV
jgi:hypothetical protein